MSPTGTHARPRTRVRSTAAPAGGRVARRLRAFGAHLGATLGAGSRARLRGRVGGALGAARVHALRAVRDRGPTRSRRPVEAAPGVDPRIHQRRMAVTRRLGRRRMVAAVSAAVVVVVVVVGWFVLHSGLTSARVVTVVGAVHTTRSEIVQAAGIDGQPLVDVSPGAAAAQVERLPWVLRARVSRRWPDGVRIVVTERRPVAAVALGRAGWAEVDATGRVLDRMATPPPGLPHLTVPGSAGAPGSDLPAAAGPGLSVLTALPPAFAAQVVAVDATAGDAVRLQLTTPVSVLLGAPVQLQEKYADVASILAYAVLHPGDVIDVTVPSSPVVAGP